MPSAPSDQKNKLIEKMRYLMMHNPSDTVDVYFDDFNVYMGKATEDQQPPSAEGEDGKESLLVSENLKSFKVIESAEGEGGPSEQRCITEFTMEDGEKIYLRITLSWVSWDGFYYEGVEDTITEVFPKEVKIIKYVTAGNL